MSVVVVHLIDGTFDLFRYFLSPAAAFDRSAPEELRAVRGVVASILGMLEHIPKLATEWDVSVRGAMRLATTLTGERERALLFRELATLRVDAPISGDVDALRWRGPRADFAVWSERLGPPALHERAAIVAATRTAVLR